MIQIKLDLDTKEKLLSQVKSTARVFAAGYVSALKKDAPNLNERAIASRIMKHIERYMTSLEGYVGVEWFTGDFDEVETAIREVVIEKFMPF